MAEEDQNIRLGRAVIQTEANALSVLAAHLDQRFDRAVQAMLATQGRIIISGIGKSGHIARKIAATLSSTGTPAHFVHPAEASHGDLGMVTPADIVLAISNSGEAPELADLIGYTRRIGVTLIGLTSCENSSLGQQADILLLMPDHEEACGTGIVPTSSTTMTLAYGDALAITLMKSRNFTSDNFNQFHPGGKLGARLAKVSHLMHTGDTVPLITHAAPMADVLLTISQKGFGVVGVLDDDGNLIGAITDGDLRRHMDQLLESTAFQVMTPQPSTIRADALAEEAVALMAGRITCLFVTENDDNRRVAGILHIHDCLRAGVV